MKTIMKTGVVLGVAVTVWSLIFGLAGWYRSAATAQLFNLVILIQIGVLLWGLRQTGLERGYWRQVGAGTAGGVVSAGVPEASSEALDSLLLISTAVTV